MLPVSKLLKRYRKIIADRIDLLFKLLVVRIKMMFSHVFFFTATIQASTSSLSKEFLVPKTISQFGITGNQFKLNTGVKIECIKSHHQMAVDGGKQSAECVFLTCLISSAQSQLGWQLWDKQPCLAFIRGKFRLSVCCFPQLSICWMSTAQSFTGSCKTTLIYPW